jgi:transcription-repair coupling factor (superfamily II helicase)
VVLLPATTALYRLAPPGFMAGYTFHFKQKQKLDEAALKRQLTLAGYSHVSQVVSPGEYAVRGGLIDLYPMGSPVPYRVDLFDDEIDSIRTFDPDSQRSLYPVPEVRLLPGREFPMDDAPAQDFRSRWRERSRATRPRARIYKDMATGVATAGIEYYLPLFFDETATFFDYLGADAALVLHGDLDEALPASGKTPRAPQVPAARPRAAGVAARGHVPAAEQFYGRCQRLCAAVGARLGSGGGRGPRCPT